MAAIHSFKDLIVYQKAYKVSMEIFYLTQSYPREETYFYPVKYDFHMVYPKLFQQT